MRGEKGISLVESLVALLLIQAGLLAIIPLFVYAARATESAATMGQVGAVAVSRFEQLRNLPFNDSELTAGAHTDTSNPAVTVTWTVTNDVAPPNNFFKNITLTATATKAPLGLAKRIVLSGQRAR